SDDGAQQDEAEGGPAADEPADRDDGQDLEDGQDDEEQDEHDPHDPAGAKITLWHTWSSVQSRCHRSRPSSTSCSCPARWAIPHWVIRRSDSRAMSGLILESPSSRSTNVIGTSLTLRPARTARTVRSTWKQYPSEATRSRPIVSRALAR